MRPALNRMRIPLRSVLNPISCRRLSVDALCDAADEDEQGVEETPFVEYLVGKHVSRRRVSLEKWPVRGAHTSSAGRLVDLRPDPDGRSTFINALEDLFIDTSLELGELVSKEQCRMMFEFEILPEFNEQGETESSTLDKLPEDGESLGAKMDPDARERSGDGRKS